MDARVPRQLYQGEVREPAVPLAEGKVQAGGVEQAGVHARDVGEQGAADERAANQELSNGLFAADAACGAVGGGGEGEGYVS